jgi:general secretion pathway protein G
MMGAGSKRTVMTSTGEANPLADLPISPERRRFSVRQFFVSLAVAGVMSGVSLQSALGIVNANPPHVTRVRHDFLQLARLVQLYKANQQRWPQSLAELSQADSETSIPRDPWGHDYAMEQRNHEAWFRTWGRDDRPGGTGFDADLTSDDLEFESARLPVSQFVFARQARSTVVLCLASGALSGVLTFRELRAGRLAGLAWANWLLAMGVWLWLSSMGAGVVAALHYIPNHH